ncbi:MAG: hypothetical protein ACJ75B_20075 [Flavisolibacter sp.]
MKRFLCILLLFITKYSSSQDIPPAGKELLEARTESREEETAEADGHYQAQLEYYGRHPLHLNTASAEELKQLHMLTDLQINGLLRYIRLLGKLIDPMELQAIPLFDLVTIRRMLPFVTTNDPPSIGKDFMLRMKGEQTILFRYSRVLQKQKGYDHQLPNHFLGSPDHLLFWYRYQYRNLFYFGITGEKDPGEQFFRGAQSSGFDFYSFHFFLRQLGCIRSLALGDYTINFGQGLIQWQSFGMGKSTEVLQIKRSAPTLLPYRSAGENNFYRGIAISLEKKKWEATGFLSCRRLSASLQDSSEYFSSLLGSGYYRTPSEIKNRHDVRVLSYGGNISYHSGPGEIGLNAVCHQLQYPMQKNGAPSQYFSFSGTKAFGQSVDYAYTWKNMHLFGEGAMDQQFHKSVMSGAILSADPKLDLSLLYRYISKDFTSLSGDAFTENPEPRNEKGIFMGFLFRYSSSLQLNVYADLFSFPWLQYRVNAPSSGSDYLMQLNYQPSKLVEWNLRFRSRSKAIDNTGAALIGYPEQQWKKNLRLETKNQLSRQFSLRTRTEIVWLEGIKNEEGFLGFAEIYFRARRGLDVNARLQYFETGSYDSRVYASESDVLFGSPVLAFYQKGFRYYLNLHYQFSHMISFWFRLAETYYPEKNSIGSGMTEIEGNRQTEVRLQTLVQLR